MVSRKYREKIANTLIAGDALEVLRKLPDNLFQACITSPPYYSLRDYGTAEWVGGDAECVHRVGNQVQDNKAPGAIVSGIRPGADASKCKLCGAVRKDQQIGIEVSPELYIAHLVDIFQEVKRVLRPDGTLWIVIADSMAGTGRGPSGHNGVGNQEQRQGFHSPKVVIPAKMKPKDMMLIPFMLASALRDDGWYMRQINIWEKPNCLSGGTMLYVRTEHGDTIMPVKDLVRLCPETVKLWNGEKWTQCVAWEKGACPDNPVEMVLRSGQRLVCTPEHFWPTQRGDVRADELQVGDTIQTCRLPEPCTPLSPKMLPDEIGWFVGMYLAEGSRSNKCMQISGHVKELERYKRLCDVAENYGGTCRMHVYGNNAHISMYGNVLNSIIDTYIVGSGAKNKHLSTFCWRRSDAFLRAVLEGYLDGDGSYEPDNKRWRIGFTRNYSLETSLRTLCARLGLQLRLNLSSNTNTTTGKRHLSFKGEIRYTKSEHHNNKQDGEIISIGKSGSRHFWDIAVEDEPHLFALASGVLTHNCMTFSGKDRTTTSHEYILHLSKNKKYYYDSQAIAEPSSHAGEVVVLGEQSFSKRQADGVGRKPSGNGLAEKYTVKEYRNKRSVWRVNTTPSKIKHYASFPIKLVEPMVLAGSAQQACEICGAPWERVYEPTGHVNKREPAHMPGNSDTKVDSTGWAPTSRATGMWQPTCTHENKGTSTSLILDPFCGVATTCLVAAQLGRDFLGIDLNPAYIDLGYERLCKELAKGEKVS